MTRSELVERLTEALEDARDLEQPLGAREVEKAVKQILEYMSGALARGDRIELRGFGSFSLHTRTAGTARNPRTGEKVRMGVRYVPHFKPGKALRERVDNARSKMP